MAGSIDTDTVLLILTDTVLLILTDTVILILTATVILILTDTADTKPCCTATLGGAALGIAFAHGEACPVET